MDEKAGGTLLVSTYSDVSVRTGLVPILGSSVDWKIKAEYLSSVERI